MSERQIDEVIDDAVRGLMSVDADEAFRARVVARLRERPSGRSRWPQLVMVSGAVATIVIAAVLFRDAGQPAGQQVPLSSTASRDAQAPVPNVTAPLPVRPSPPAQRRGGTRSISAPPPVPTVNVTQEIPRGSLLAAVAHASDGGTVERGGFHRIDVQPITAVAIRPPELVIAPLAPISPLVIAPLDSRRERN